MNIDLNRVKKDNTMNKGKAILSREILHEIDIELDGKEVARLFWGLDCKEQAEFFNELYDEHILSWQLQKISEQNNLSPLGKTAMMRIGEYSK